MRFSVSKKSAAVALATVAVFGASAVLTAPAASAHPGAIGRLDDAWVHSDGHLYVAGWACNPNTVPTQQTRVIDYPNGGSNWDWDSWGPLANGSRPDVAKVYPACGSHTGFTGVITAFKTHPGAKICIDVFDSGTPLDSQDVIVACKTAIAHN